MRIQILGSSSSGNCAFLETDDSAILIDAGFTGRKIDQFLKARNRSVKDIQAVFLTHEHGDHTAGLRGLARHAHLSFFATHGTAQAAQRSLKRDLPWRIFEANTSFSFRDLEITAISIPHDAYDPVGYIFRTGGDSLFTPRRSIAWITDLGHIPAHLGPLIRDVDLVVLESNHCSELLANDTTRPYLVKQRIGGRHGHLSNTAAREFLQSIPQPRWQHIVLAHLSRDCNEPERVIREFESLNADYKIDIIDPHGNNPLDISIGTHLSNC